MIVDGVMRLNECEQVQRDLSEHLGIHLTVVDASQQFLQGLKGIDDPEKKRKFIGMPLNLIFLCSKCAQI
jgi:GMP synthase (glutamine-hydrolysing)